MARKKKKLTVLERYLPRGHRPDKYQLGEMIRGIQRNHDANPWQFKEDFKAIGELEKLRSIST